MTSSKQTTHHGHTPSASTTRRLPTPGLPGVTDILPGTGLPEATDITSTGVPSGTRPDGVLPATGLPGVTDILPSRLSLVAPASNEAYYLTSGEFNPIHVNPYFSDFAARPGTTTHVMLRSAATHLTHTRIYHT
ncbi:hypothetical protein CF319_g8593 [Tilletia indica]|uniref:Uncharacterized protein n=1 Tax=Tilletia indica TaxID=43049 RepID=A0A177TA88_9BASI|nr:hypothetical protein CF319_g8593 [Tilletia indica]KAE8240225.1 hypothetical protein A4X13_0g7892 [Tilletia indica]